MYFQISTPNTLPVQNRSLQNICWQRRRRVTIEKKLVSSNEKKYNETNVICNIFLKIFVLIRKKLSLRAEEKTLLSEHIQR